MIKENKRFYFRTDNQNNESTEVFVGQNAGNQLNNDILNAKNEVLIISPYIDETKLDDLIMLKNRNVNIRLAFSDLREQQNKDILKKLIHQQTETDLVKKEKREKQKNIFFFASVAMFCIGIISFLLFIFNIKEKINIVKNIITLFVSIASFYGFYKSWRKKLKIEKIEIYTYHYSEKLNFKYIRNNRLENKFIHSKIYIIDRKIAYLGSLNYTRNGFTTNFETRVRITQQEKVNDLVNFVHEIFEDNLNFKKHEIDYLGKQVYTEEKY